jgi:hypothetical protein
MQIPEINGSGGFGWHTFPAPHPPPNAESPHALPRIAHESGGTVAWPPFAAHAPPVTVGGGEVTDTLQAPLH